MTPIQVEIIFPLISTVEFACRRCSPVMDQVDLVKAYHESCQDDYPEDWRQSMEDLHAWIRRSKELYKHRICILLVDAQSPAGLWKQIRYRLFKMPAFIVDGKWGHTGWDTERLEALIDARIRETAEQMSAGVFS